MIMKKVLLSSLLAAGVCAMFNACSDDSPSPITPPVAATSSSVVWEVQSSSSVGLDSSSSNPALSAADVPLSSAMSSSNVGDLPASSPANSSSSSAGNPTSSAMVNPGSNGSVAGSSAGTVPESSSSKEPELDASGFPTLESYGPPPAEYTKDISATAKRGWNTRYWDACKPHCSWLRESANDITRADTSSNEAYIADYGTARNCNIHDVEVPTFTLGDVSKSWFGYNGTRSACGDEKEKGVFTCTDMAPIAVNDTLSYAYVAGTADSKCGKCYHLQYDGHFANEMENNPPRETHRALKGKHMIVMASNIGNDVAG
ncbi:MAG: glycosyl hydrolase family 5, partial [Fibrobacter sp.]|nr:glycosyl hydrolase family 5 [Fibrobacter sp.]